MSVASDIEAGNTFSSSKCDCTSTVSYDECIGVNEPICYENFPRRLECLSPGVIMSETLTFRMSDQQNREKLKCAEMAFMCQVQLKVNKTFNDINNAREGRFTTVYIGSFTGVFTSHPGTIANCDDPYDARLRPWFVLGSTGARNIIIFFKIKEKKNRA